MINRNCISKREMVSKGIVDDKVLQSAYKTPVGVRQQSQVRGQWIRKDIGFDYVFEDLE